MVLAIQCYPATHTGIQFTGGAQQTVAVINGASQQLQWQSGSPSSKILPAQGLALDDFVADALGFPGMMSSSVKTFRQADYKSALLACAVMMVVVWQFVVPFLANTPCGLIIPHEHILLGGAGDTDLAGHVDAEAACAVGKPASPQQQASDLHGHHGHVVNVIHLDQNTTTHVVSLFSLAAILLIPLALHLCRQLHDRLDPLHLLGLSVAIPPPKPPPLAA